MDPTSYIHIRWIGTGKPETRLLEDVRNHLESTFRAPARVAHAWEQPPDFFDPTRGQYSSTKTLRWLLDDVPSDARKVLALTDCDLFIPVLTFVFGEAQLGGTGAVVSTARLRLDRNGSPCAPDLFRARVLKECAHEVGHTFGLAHCARFRCAMSRSNSLADVDAKSSRLCWECRAELNAPRAREE